MINLFNRMIDDKTGEEYIVKDAEAREAIREHYDELSGNLTRTIELAGTNAKSIETNAGSIITDSEAIILNAGSNSSEAESIELLSRAVNTLSGTTGKVAAWMTGVNAEVNSCKETIQDYGNRIEQLAGEIPAGMVHMSAWKQQTTLITIPGTE